MAGRSSIKVEGLEALRKSLANGREYMAVEVTQALEDSAKMIRSEAERLAPRGPTGNLKRALRQSLGRATKTFLQSFVFALAQIAPHAHLVEFGTRPHTIKPHKKGGVLVFGRYFAKEVNHPGAKAWPFFQTAVRNKRMAVRRRIETAVEAVTQKLNAQAA